MIKALLGYKPSVVSSFPQDKSKCLTVPSKVQRDLPIAFISTSTVISVPLGHWDHPLWSHFSP